MQPRQPLAEGTSAPVKETTAPASSPTANPNPATVAEGGRPGEVRLTGFRLSLARVVWLVVALLSLGLYVAVLPVSYDHILKMTIFSDPAQRAIALQGLANRGLSAQFLADYTVGLNVFRSLVY